MCKHTSLRGHVKQKAVDMARLAFCVACDLLHADRIGRAGLVFGAGFLLGCTGTQRPRKTWKR